MMRPTYEEYIQMDPETKRATMEDMNRRVDAVIRQTFAKEILELDKELEESLIPKISFRPTAPPAPPVPVADDQDTAAREFFRRFPETRQIQIGSTLYQR
jgi:hypothetical protein